MKVDSAEQAEDLMLEMFEVPSKMKAHQEQEEDRVKHLEEMRCLERRFEDVAKREAAVRAAEDMITRTMSRRQAGLEERERMVFKRENELANREGEWALREILASDDAKPSKRGDDIDDELPF